MGGKQSSQAASVHHPPPLPPPIHKPAPLYCHADYTQFIDMSATMEIGNPLRAASYNPPITKFPFSNPPVMPITSSSLACRSVWEVGNSHRAASYNPHTPLPPPCHPPPPSCTHQQNAQSVISLTSVNCPLSAVAVHLAPFLRLCVSGSNLYRFPHCGPSTAFA